MYTQELNQHVDIISLLRNVYCILSADSGKFIIYILDFEDYDWKAVIITIGRIFPRSIIVHCLNDAMKISYIEFEGRKMLFS